MRTTLEKWRTSPVVAGATIALLSVLMACFNYKAPLSNISPGLDSAWAYTLNYLFQHDILIGRDAFFTFGPLGFLEHTRNLSESILNYSLYFWLAMVLLVNALSYRLAFTTANNVTSLIFYLLIASVLLLNIYNGGQKLLVALYITALLAWLTQKYGYILLLGLLASLVINIKFSYGAVALIALCGTAFTLSVQLKSPRPLIAAGLSFTSSYLAIWLAVGGGFVEAARYFSYGLEFTRGSASAMATYPGISSKVIAGCIISLVLMILLTLSRLKPKGMLMALTFLVISFIWLKYSFGRMDSGHLTGVINFAYCFFLISLMLNNSMWVKVTSSLLMLGFFILWNACHNAQTGSPSFKGVDLRAQQQEWFFSQINNDKIFKHQQHATQKHVEKFQLSESIREKLGNSSATIYPWENFIAHANQINWQPMPVFQNYIAYTPKLDHRNALFFEDEKSPKFIIWHHHSFASIDNRHHLSGDPRTVTAILTHYQKTLCDTIACLWEKRNVPIAQREKQRQHVPIVLGKWLPLPEGDSHRFYISSQLTLKGMMYNALWKEAELKIEYAFENGKTRQHRFIRENAKHGIWVSPYTSKPNQPLTTYGKVKAIRFKTSHPQHYKKWIGYWSVNEFTVEQL